MEGVQRRNDLYGFEFREPDMRRAVGERKTYDVKQMWQRSHEIVNLAARGFKNTEIADILNINPATVSSTLNGELGQRKLSELRYGRDQEAKKVVEKIRVLSDKALNVYHQIFDDESGETNLKDKGGFASDFLKEMSGLRAPTQIQSHNISTTLTRDEIEAFKMRGINAAREAGRPIDIEPAGTQTSVCDPAPGPGPGLDFDAAPDSENGIDTGTSEAQSTSPKTE